MPLIQFPDVPNVAGVPALLRSATVPTPDAILSSVTGSVSDSVLGPVVWGIYDEDGNKVLDPDTFLGIDYRNDSRVSNYPQEQGAFASYNKVETPFDCRVSMAIGSDKAARTAFLDTLEALRKGLDLLTIVTPEVSYPSANLTTYSYRRTATNGVSMLTVELDFTEVRVTATAEFSSPDPVTPADPQPPADDVPAPPPVADEQVNSAPAVSGGQVQAAPPTAAQDAPTNFASGSVNDSLGQTLTPQAAQQLQTSQADPAAQAAMGQDRLNNPPPGLNSTELANYNAGIKDRYGLT